jgi:hypothetical protein
MMRYAGLALVVLCCWAAPSSHAYQEGKLTVVSATPKELKRSAHRLRIPVEQLKNVRTLLREATDLAVRLDPAPAHLSNLARVWVLANRPEAVSAIRSMYDALRAKAQDGTGAANVYFQATAGSQALLGGLAELDAELAIRLMNEWPEPPAVLGAAAEKATSSLKDNFRAQLVASLSQRDPAKAMELRSQMGAAAVTDYSARARLAQQMIADGKREEALKLVDEAIADSRQRAWEPRAVADYAQFIQQLPAVDPDRFVAALGSLSQIPAQAVPQLGSSLQTGSGSTPTTFLEFQLLNTLRGLQGRPELALKALEAAPELKAKVDRLGGIDNVLNPHSSVMPSAGDFNFADMSSLYEQLRGKGEKNPGFVRQKLAAAAKTPAQMQMLILLAQRANLQDPEVASMALEAAGKLLPLEDNLNQRALMFSNLVRAYRQCEGEVDAELLREGFILADDIRQQQAEPLQPGALRNPTADRLESVLIAEYVRDNFDAARRYLRSLPDDSFKLQILVQTAQSLTQQ